MHSAWSHTLFMKSDQRERERALCVVVLARECLITQAARAQAWNLLFSRIVSHRAGLDWARGTAEPTELRDKDSEETLDRRWREKGQGNEKSPCTPFLIWFCLPTRIIINWPAHNYLHVTYICICNMNICLDALQRIIYMYWYTLFKIMGSVRFFGNT